LRRLIVSNVMSLDGFMAGPKGELDWFVTEGFLKNTEYGQHARDLISSVDAILLGRLTYEEFVGYWPTAENNDPVITDGMNKLPKIVFSKTLDKVEWGKWGNARLVKSDAASEVRRMKQGPGKPLVIYGSGQLASDMLVAGLVDEYQVTVQPVILGRGKPLFPGIDDRRRLKLISAKPFKSGPVELIYQASTL
jgi:dihydrofolate reductase